MRRDKKRSLKKSEARLGIILLIPTASLILAVIIYPIIYNFVMSYYKVALNPNREDVYIGLVNYIKLFKDESFYTALFTTAIYVASTVAGSTVMGVLMALLLNKEFKGRKVARSLVLLPYVAPMVALVYVWKYMFNGLYGVINYLTVDVLHIFSQNPMWFDHKVYSFLVVVFFDIWRVFPYSFLMILAALQSIDTTLYEAAEVDGAGPWRSFWAITYSEILPSVAAIVTLRTIWNFYKFDDVFLLTKNIPILGVYLYQAAFATHDIGRAAAITIVLFIIVFTFVVFLGRKVIKR